MPVSKREIEKLSADVRRLIDGQDIDLRDNREGALSLLKNDIHTLASLKNEQANALMADREALKNRLADISHQLKTPLTQLMIISDLLENAPKNKQAEFVWSLKTSLYRMEWLVSALLKMAKIGAGAVEFSRGRASSGELIALALKPLHILLEVKNQQIRTAGEAALICDAHWTAEALTNIIKNASEHSPVGAEILIESGENPICAWISVTDGGLGLTKAETAAVFKRYQTSKNESGYGIGLPLALAIMRGQNGDIAVDGGGDAAGKGATFTLKFYK